MQILEFFEIETKIENSINKYFIVEISQPIWVSLNSKKNKQCEMLVDAIQNY